MGIQTEKSEYLRLLSENSSKEAEVSSVPSACRSQPPVPISQPHSTLTAMASVTEASSTLPRWPQKMELTRCIRKISSWIRI